MDEGLLLVAKERGRRSSGCVADVRSILGKKVRVGHAGTLDSTASGLLLLLIGPLTRVSSYAMALPKRYRVRIRLGMETDTCDGEGELLSQKPWGHVTEELLDRELLAFHGCRLQTPPLISAVHVQGRRAHELARKGEDFAIEPRPVWISEIQRLSSIDECGEVDLEISCHQGTYVRSLARDLGRRLHCGATVVELCRTHLGNLTLPDALPGKRLSEMSPQDLARHAISQECFCAHFASYRCDEAGREILAKGLSLPLAKGDRLSFGVVSPERFLCFCGPGLLSFGSIDRGKGLFRPRANIFLRGQ